MGRIAEQELERLKQEVSVQRLAEAAGVKLKGHGKDLLGLCPFHDDREPSLVITPSKNVWHCLGACQAGGSVIDWVMKAQGVSFRYAVELLREEHPSLAAPVAAPQSGRPPADGETRKVPKRTTTRRHEALAAPEEPDEVVLRRVVDYYHETLKQSPEALGYLAERGLRHAELIEHFRLGFANRTLAYRLPEKNRKQGAAIREQLQRLGVLRDSGHEHLRGSLVIPVIDAEGRVTELYGRKIGRVRPGTPLHLYLPGPQRGVFNAPALAHSKEVILCESLLDALTFWCAGYRNVTAAYGVEGFTQELHEALREHGTERVLIAYDRDAAGDKAAAKLSAALAQDGLASFRVQFPKGMDANEYALKVQPASKSLDMLLRHAVWLAGPKRAVAAKSEPREPDLSSLAAEQPAAIIEPPRESAPAAEHRDDGVVIHLGDRRWRIRGLDKNLTYERLKVNVLVGRGEAFFVDTLELYSARHRALFLKQAATELDTEERVLKKDLGQVLMKLEALQDAQIKKALETGPKRVELSDSDKQAALGLLKDPKLVERIVSDFDRCGVVGEETNKLMGYLAAVSRKLEEPLAVVIQSSSAAGKSSLMEAILRFVPEEERVQYSAMTGQSLFYMGESDLTHKILAIAEEEGASNASYALKLLQSEGELTIASTGKDPQTGRLVTHEYRVQGPVMLFLTTTAIEVDEELLNRCIVLTVDEGREQTQAIHALQRKSHTLEGLLARQDRGRILKLHQDAQRLLRPLLVANPYATELSFRDHKTRTRRDHMKYLTLIRAIALLHQYQRPVKTIEHQGAKVRYIEVDKRDIELADRLCAEVLFGALDELPAQTRRLLGHIVELVKRLGDKHGLDACDVRFSRRDVREHTGWGHTQLKVHIGRLEELEYLQVCSGGPRRRMVYALSHDYDANWSGPEPHWSGSGRPLVGGQGRPALSGDSDDKLQLVGPGGHARIGDAGRNGTSYSHPATDHRPLSTASAAS